MTDNIHKPPHYTRGNIEVRDFIADQGLNFNRGSAVKYISRAGFKDPTREIEDLKKAISCLEHEVARLGGDDVDRDLREGVVRSSEDEQRRRERVAAFKSCDQETER